MNLKVLVSLGLVAAFFMGMAMSGVTTRAFNAPAEEPVVAEMPATSQSFARASTPAVRPRAVAQPVQPAFVPEAAPVASSPEKKRTWQKEALIVGGSAGAGAAIGAVAGGKKGAAIGAVSGGVAGLVYDLATRNK